MSVKVNDVVIFSKYAGTEIKIGGEDYIILDEDSILAIKESE
jgi:chaperonin GroES